MAQLRCPECHTLADVSATSCPQCGAPLPKLRARPGRLLAAVTLIAVAAVLGFFVLKPDSDIPQPIRQEPKAINVADLQAKVDSGDADAMNQLGRAYLEGQGVEIDYTKAADLFQKAADLGHADAQASLGMLYDAGQGVPTDPEQAMKWLQSAAQQNHAEAAYNLGSMYGSREKSEEAAKWYLKAAQLGDALAQYNVAQRYHLGRGVPADPVEAYKWYELSARQGVPDSAEARDKLKPSLSAQQLQEATQRAANWKPEK